MGKIGKRWKEGGLQHHNTVPEKKVHATGAVVEARPKLIGLAVINTARVAPKLVDADDVEAGDGAVPVTVLPSPCRRRQDRDR